MAIGEGNAGAPPTTGRLSASLPSFPHASTQRESDENGALSLSHRIEVTGARANTRAAFHSRSGPGGAIGNEPVIRREYS